MRCCRAQHLRSDSNLGCGEPGTTRYANRVVVHEPRAASPSSRESGTGAAVLLPRQVGLARQELVDRPRCLATLADRPYHQRLAAPHVAAGEDLVDAALI